MLEKEIYLELILNRSLEQGFYYLFACASFK